MQFNAAFSKRLPANKNDRFVFVSSNFQRSLKSLAYRDRCARLGNRESKFQDPAQYSKRFRRSVVFSEKLKAFPTGFPHAVENGEEIFAFRLES